MFKKFLIILSLVLAVVLLLVLNTPAALARQGCCAWHNGVCPECKCCDGSPLSEKCAQYYSQCEFSKKDRATKFVFASQTTEIGIDKAWWVLIFVITGAGAIAFLAKIK